MSRSAPFVIVALVAAAALGGGTYLYHSKRTANLPLKISKGAGEQETKAAHVLGPADAAVTLEEFGDFQCPPCGRLSEPINQLQKKYNICVIYRNFPLPVHQHAKEAAYAAEAAALQGRFWEMHDMLFREQAVWSNSGDARALFTTYAGMLQLDLGRFKQDMESSEVQHRVEVDKERGAAIGVSNTPTIFLNNQAVPPPQLNPESLAAAVESVMKSAKPSS
jgi:NhaA family Na+:H+ antiporter